MFVYSKKLILIIFILSPIIAKRAIQKKYVETKLIFNELSAKHELNDYLASLERIIDFCKNNIYYLDVNLAFGLFLMNVHLKTILIDEHKYNGLPKSLRDKILHIVSKNDQISRFFKIMVINKQRTIMNADFKIATMFMNEYKWMKRLPKFNTDLVKNQLRYSQFNKKKEWKSYSTDVLNPDNWIPSPNISDKCISSLASIPIKRTGKFTQCKISFVCKKMIMNGTNFGYAFTHRLLLLQSAHFARGCRIFSDQLDMDIRNSICAAAYHEAEYISVNDYGIVDLMMEIIGLCALDGHSQFLRSSWLKDTRRFQTPHGCFSDKRLETWERLYNTRNTSYDVEWKIDKENKLINDKCNGHMTAVAATTFSAAARFIIETYY